MTSGPLLFSSFRFIRHLFPFRFFLLSSGFNASLFSDFFLVHGPISHAALHPFDFFRVARSLSRHAPEPSLPSRLFVFFSFDFFFLFVVLVVQATRYTVGGKNRTETATATAAAATYHEQNTAQRSTVSTRHRAQHYKFFLSSFKFILFCAFFVSLDITEPQKKKKEEKEETLFLFPFVFFYFLLALVAVVVQLAARSYIIIILLVHQP